MLHESVLASHRRFCLAPKPFRGRDAVPSCHWLVTEPLWSGVRFCLFPFLIMVVSVQACHRPSREQRLVSTLTLVMISLFRQLRAVCPGVLTIREYPQPP